MENRHTTGEVKDLVLIESEGLLFRGPVPSHPLDVWDYPRKRWVRYADAGPQGDGWGIEIDSARAEKLKIDNPHAEHYLYYDRAPWL